MSKNSATLTKGPIGKTLAKLTLPMTFGVFSVVGFNLVDAFFVGKLGAMELAALGFVFPVVMVVGSIGMGIGMGTAATVSRAIGENDRDRVLRLTTDSILFALLLGAVFVIFGIWSLDGLFTLLGATPEVLPLIREYMVIWYLGVPCILVPMVGSSAIRANGDTKTPAIIMVSLVIVNVILDPIFIFGWGPVPALGLKGAAIATVIARFITLLMGLYVLYFRDRFITFIIPSLQKLVDSWKSVLYIGLPAAGTNLVVPLTTALITNLVASYGPEAVAGLGVASRIDVLAITVIIALSSALGPFIGQNLGAMKIDRLKTGVNLSIRFALIWGVGMLVLLFLTANFIAPLFSNDPKVIDTIILYLFIAPFSYSVRGVYTVSNTILNVLNKPLQASLVTLLQMFAVYIPLAYLGAHFFGLAGIFGAMTVAYLVGGTVGYFLVNRSINNMGIPEDLLDWDNSSGRELAGKSDINA